MISLLLHEPTRAIIKRTKREKKRVNSLALTPFPFPFPYNHLAMQEATSGDQPTAQSSIQFVMLCLETRLARSMVETY